MATRVGRASSRTGSNRSLTVDGAPIAAGVDPKKRGGRFSEASLHAKAASVPLGIVIPASAAVGAGALLPPAAASSSRVDAVGPDTTAAAPAPVEQVAVEVK